MKKIDEIIQSFLPTAPFDAVAVGVIDFKKRSFEVSETSSDVYFDLASLTKPLTNSLSYFLKPEAFDEKMLLCLSHRGELPAWGLLPKEGWEAQILGYPVKESETLYSDFSALRVMLELKQKKIDQKNICQSIWDSETVNWLDLPAGVKLLQTGYKDGEPNFGAVHDPNAWTINSFCSHAGLFSTVQGVCKTLINYQSKTDFISKVKVDLGRHSHRFAYGWDRVTNPQDTLAGNGCGPSTFGHLGFTGTSIWIDPDKMRGHVILTNAVKHHWFDKACLNEMRRELGQTIWKM